MMPPVPRPYRGDVWKVAFPNRPNDPHLPRPAIVISNDLINENADAVLVIPVTDEALFKKNKLLPTHVFIPKKTGGLDKDSRAMCEQIVSVEKTKLVEGPLGKIPSVVMTSLVQALRRAVE